MKTNLKKLLATVTLLTVAIPSTLTVVACGKNKTKQESENTNSVIVNAINKTDYKISIMVNTKVDYVKFLITGTFIESQLSENIKKIFLKKEFTINKITNKNDEELLDIDLQKVKIINAKINYDYADFKGQTTNLEINIQSKPILLKDVFKDFKFKDEKGVKDFLNTNALSSITEQIEVHLGTSLDQAGLILGNRTSNSILLKAKPDSRKYVGEVTLTWNLKLFEIYGMEHQRGENKWVREGLKGYFYLETGTNQIKYFDVVWYFNWSDRDAYNPDFYDYHWFHFINQNNEEKYFIFKGDWWTDQVAGKFGNFAFTKEVRVIIDSPELSRVKFFNKTYNKWVDLTKKTKFVINFLGEVNQIN